MSQENVEIVPAAFAPWTASEIDAFREGMAPRAMIVRGLGGWPERAP